MTQALGAFPGVRLSLHMPSLNACFGEVIEPLRSLKNTEHRALLPYRCDKIKLSLLSFTTTTAQFSADFLD